MGRAKRWPLGHLDSREAMTGAHFHMMLFGAAIFLAVALDSLNAALMGLESERDYE